MRLFLCEKPSQAADIAKALGQATKRETHWDAAGGSVTWAFGHLLENLSPEDYNTAWKTWSFATLPMLPPEYRIAPRHGVGARLKEIGQLLRQASEVVIATDAGREGEVIAREILDYHRYRGPLRRLWLDATDIESVRQALQVLRPGESTEPLYWAGLTRSRADWVVGLNMTRAMTLLANQRGNVTSVGRVQTPTLALVVRRDRERKGFRAVTFHELSAHDLATGLTLRHAPPEDQRITDSATAARMLALVQGATSRLRVMTESRSKAPPLPHDLASLQAEANRRLGWTAKRTLDVAQSLYERYKATSYPRTECRYLPAEQIADAPQLFRQVTTLPPFHHLQTETPTARKSIYDTSKVVEHHGIIPTKTPLNWSACDEEGRALYGLIVAQWLAGLLPDYRYASTEVVADLKGLRFAARGIQPLVEGWRMAFQNLGDGVARKASKSNAQEDKEESSEEDEEGEEGTGSRLPPVKDGETFTASKVSPVERSTIPPPAYTEARLIEDMKSVAKFVSDPAQRARLKETSGLGTAATRHEVLETLKHHEYLVTKGRKLSATEKAHALIAFLEKEMPDLADVAESAVWEDALDAIAKGKSDQGQTFLRSIEQRVRAYVEILRARAPAPSSAPPPVDATGVTAGRYGELSDAGEYFTAPKLKGRLYKTFFGHVFTVDEAQRLLAGEVLTLSDCRTSAGKPMSPRAVRFDAGRKPFPGVVFAN